MLLRNYHTIEVLNYPLEDGLEMYKNCQLKEREDRLYLLWVAYFTNPMASGKRKGWAEFYAQTTATQEAPEKRSTGNIRGVDLAQLKR